MNVCSAGKRSSEDWRCGGCGEPSGEPAPDELITCPTCGIQGVTSKMDRERMAEWDRTAERIAELDALTREPRPEEVWDSLTSFRLRAIAAAAASVARRQPRSIRVAPQRTERPPLRLWRPCKRDTGLFHGPLRPAYLPKSGPFKLRGVIGTDRSRINDKLCVVVKTAFAFIQTVKLIEASPPTGREWQNTGDEHPMPRSKRCPSLDDYDTWYTNYDD